MGALAQVLRGLPACTDPNLLVGTDYFDDAGVYRLDASTGIVLTVDFFPPLVDDPFVFGQIAAANALSDVYAMGGTPLAVLNIVGFPDKDLPVELLAEILRGGADRVAAAGAVVAGGHSVRDAEIKYGLSVTGRVDPGRILTNSGAQPGDVLILTKPIGTAQLTTAAKQGKIEQADLTEAIASMIELNKGACEAITQLAEEFGVKPLPEPRTSVRADEKIESHGEPRTLVRADEDSVTHGEPRTSVRRDDQSLPPSQGGTKGGSTHDIGAKAHRSTGGSTSPDPLLGNEGRKQMPPVSVGGVHAVTDITGFGLLGHAFEIAQASGVTIEIDSGQVPLMARTLELAQAGVLTRAHKSNLEYIAEGLDAGGVDEKLVKVLADAQTSGGLLIAVAPDKAYRLIELLKENKTPAVAVVGSVKNSEQAAVVVRA